MNTDQQLAALLERAGRAADFAATEMPDAVSQLLLYRAVEGWLLVAAGVVLLVGTAIGCVKGWRYAKREHKYDLPPAVGIIVLCSMFPVVFGVVALCTGIMQALMIHLAPKAYLLEQAARMFWN